MENSVKNRVIRLIEEVFGEESNKLGLEAKIGTDIALTSLDRMTLFISLEDEFDRTIPQEEIENLVSVGEVVEFIEKKLSLESGI